MFKSFYLISILFQIFITITYLFDESLAKTLKTTNRKTTTTTSKIRALMIILAISHAETAMNQPCSFISSSILGKYPIKPPK